MEKDPEEAINSIERNLIERQLAATQNDNGNLGSFIKQNQLFQPTPVRGAHEKAAQERKKANLFVDEALRMLHKHFRQWSTEELLPAALLHLRSVLLSLVITESTICI